MVGVGLPRRGRNSRRRAATPAGGHCCSPASDRVSAQVGNVRNAVRWRRRTPARWPARRCVYRAVVCSHGRVTDDRLRCSDREPCSPSATYCLAEMCWLDPDNTDMRNYYSLYIYISISRLLVDSVISIRLISTASWVEWNRALWTGLKNQG